MDTRIEIGNKIVVVIITIIIVFIANSCTYKANITNLIGFSIKKYIKFEKKESNNNFFESSDIIIYTIKDTLMLNSIAKDWIQYDSTHICSYCGKTNTIYNYIKHGKGYFKVNSLSKYRFEAIYIDIEHNKLIYHQISYTL